MIFSSGHGVMNERFPHRQHFTSLREALTRKRAVVCSFSFHRVFYICMWVTYAASLISSSFSFLNQFCDACNRPAPPAAKKHEVVFRVWVL